MLAHAGPFALPYKHPYARLFTPGPSSPIYLPLGPPHPRVRGFPPRPQLAEKAAAGAAAAGYLHKYRGHAESSLWANTWENRYVVRGSCLVLGFGRRTATASTLPAGSA